MAGKDLKPSWQPVKEALKALKDQVGTVLSDGEDQEGRLSEANRKLAERAVNEIDGVMAMIGVCPQGLSPYRK